MYVSVCLQKLINIRFYSRPIPNIINIIVLLLVLHIRLYSILDSICIFVYDCCCSGDGDVVNGVVATGSAGARRLSY